MNTPNTVAEYLADLLEREQRTRRDLNLKIAISEPDHKPTNFILILDEGEDEERRFLITVIDF